ncbi:hypothetical protein YC2023_085540 [Brassica napus]
MKSSSFNVERSTRTGAFTADHQHAPPDVHLMPPEKKKNEWVQVLVDWLVGEVKDRKLLRENRRRHLARTLVSRRRFKVRTLDSRRHFEYKPKDRKDSPHEPSRD